MDKVYIGFNFIHAIVKPCQKNARFNFMQSKAFVFCDRLIEFCIISAIIVTPLYFNIYSHRIFEPDKIILLQSITLLMLFALAVSYLEKKKNTSSELEEATNTNSITNSLKYLFADCPFILPAFFLVTVSIISSFFSVHPHDSFWGSYQRLQGTFSILSAVAVFLILLKQVRKQEQISQIVSVMIITSIPTSLYGIFQHFGLDPLPWHDDVVGRVAANMGNSVFLAAYLIMVMPLTLARLLASIKSIQQKISCTKSIQLAGLPISYLIILVIQAACILFTGSRGPWIGLLTGLFFFTVILGALNDRRWIVWLAISLVAGSMFFVLLLNQPHTLLEPLKKIDCFNRLGSLTDTESGSGNVRDVLWKGCIDLLTADTPIKFPDGRVDPFHRLRPFIGYGPETMGLVFNRFYSPALAQVEGHKALPDRAHNATFDLLITTGIVGFLAEMLLFAVVFYYGFLWLGLLGAKKQRLFFFVLLLGGATAGTVSFGFWWGKEFVGIGFPAGVVVGMGVYLLVWFFQYRDGDNRKEKLPIFSQTLLAALLAAVIAHFVEIHFGFASSASRLYFWITIGLMAAIFQVNNMQQPVEDSLPGRDGNHFMVHAALPLTVIIITMSFIFTHNNRDITTIYSITLSPFVRELNDGHVHLSIAMVCMYGITIILGTGIMTAELRQNNDLCQPGWRWKASGKTLFLLLIVSLPVLLILAHFLTAIPGQTDSLKLAALLVNIESFYYLILLIVCIFFAFMQARPGTSDHIFAGRGRWIIYLFLLGGTFYLVVQTQLKQVMADTYSEQAQTYYKRGRWDDGITLETQAIDLSPGEDSYYRKLSTNLVEKAKKASSTHHGTSTNYHFDDLLAFTPAEIARLGKFDLLEYSSLAATKAQHLNPLNVDNTAKLGQINRIWANFLPAGERRNKKLQHARDYYRQAVALKPGDPLLWDELGRIYFLLGKHREALEKYSHSLTLDDRVQHTYLLLGDTYIAIQKLDKASAMYQKALSLAPTTIKTHLVLGYIYIKQGRFHEAIRENETILSLQPDNYQGHKNLAVLYQSVKQYSKALEHAKTAYGLSPIADRQPLQKLIFRLQQRLTE
ncbi:MAG: hypothetical protein DRH04_04705 [Deltaproteobacteria bacterium]|nr:MAG: hypothetical protein DRH04_04705 [Deltaproteobacteria bacterium]